MVFVVSPAAVKSERCVWEVDKALVEAKRLLPVISKAVPESDIPEQLRRRQFVRFDTGVGFTRPLAQLAEALRQDIDWVREHTRLGELARRWDARGRAESLLLRGDDIAAAQGWAERRSPDAPEITDLMRAFIGASKETEASFLVKSSAAQRRTIRMQWLVGTMLVCIIFGLVGVLNEDYLKEQWRWFTQVRSYVLAGAAERTLKPGDAFKECTNDCPEMVVVPAGEFIMGSPTSERDRVDNEQPQHKVVFAKPFVVAKFDVTFDDWDACTGYGNLPARNRQRLRARAAAGLQRHVGRCPPLRRMAGADDREALPAVDRGRV